MNSIDVHKNPTDAVPIYGIGPDGKPLHRPVEIKAACSREPIVYDNVRPDLCAQLAEVILARAARDQSTPSLNRGGWKSTETLFQWGHPAIRELERTALYGMLGGRAVGWAMVNRNGSGHPRHQHRLAVLVGVYYVTAGDPAVPTIYECADGSELEITPAPGRLVIAPGDMWHRVPAYPGDSPRITIVCDVRR